MRPNSTTYRLARLLLPLLLAAGGCAAAPVKPRQCGGGLQGSFLQLTDRQLGFGARDWVEPFALLRATGADTLIVQFTGDRTGAYDDRAHARAGGPVRAVLSAAAVAGLKVYLGLHADPSWPSEAALGRLPPPLEDAVQAQGLGQMCRTSEACAGWYLPGEIDDETWRSAARTRALADHLARAAALLRGLAPGKPVVVAPFYTGKLEPEAHARWWGELMRGRPFDVLALQDGVGTGRVTPERAAAYLRALAPVAAAAGVRLWTVVELFHQLHGAPHDERPFAAEAAPFATVRIMYLAPRPLIGLLIGGALLGACQADEPDHSSTSRIAATTMIHNPAPGMGDPAPMEEGLARTFSGEAVELAQSQLSSGTGGALVLYDKSGPYGALGELYGIGAANLVSHFGNWTAKAATAYVCGEMAGFTALVYLGSTYDEPLPNCLLDEIVATTKPVIWSFYNIWRLATRMGDAAFIAKYGFSSLGLDFSAVAEVRYKGRSLHRYSANAAGVLNTSVVDATKAKPLAMAVRPDGTTFPWAMRSGNFTYVGEIPFSYMSEEDRMLVFADLLFDALAPATVERHRALVRLEDISANTDAVSLRAVADYLYAQKIPFGFGVVPEYRDPKGVYNSGKAERIRLQDNRTMATLLKDMAARGGVMIMHGNTHQWDTAINPYNQVSADDYEFFRVTENADHTLTYQGPIPGENTTWSRNRILTGELLFSAAGLAVPKIFEFPHYSASATAYAAAGALFPTRWERSLYFNGLLAGTAVNYSRIFGQLFPYVVRDVYGTKVLPENLGNIEPIKFYEYPTRFPADIIRAAEKNLVVRDGFASFYFHPFFDLSMLRETVDGIRALGYTFVSPASL